MYRSQSSTLYFSCARTMRTSSIPLDLGETVSASPHRSLGLTPYTCSTSCTCRKAVPPGPPFGRKAQQVRGLLAEKLTSLKVFSSPPSIIFWITDACNSPPCRHQFESRKPSNATYFSRLFDASRQPAHADWASILSALTLKSRVSERNTTEPPSLPIVVPLQMDVASISPVKTLTAQRSTTKEGGFTSCPTRKHPASRSGTGHVILSRFHLRSFLEVH